MLRLSGFELYSRWVPLFLVADFCLNRTSCLLKAGSTQAGADFVKELFTTSKIGVFHIIAK